MANRERVVEFAVKARDEYSKVLKNLEQQQAKLSAATQAANRRAVVGVANAELTAAQENYKRLAADVDRYNAILDKGRRSGSLSAAEMRELGETIKLVRDRSREAMAAVQQKQAALASLTRSSTAGFAAVDRLAVAMQKETAAADASRAATLAAAAADEKAAAVAARKAEIRARLNNQVQSGYANWNQYVETVQRIRAAEEKSAAVAALKTRIRERLNNTVKSGYSAFILATEGSNRETRAAAANAAELNKLAAASRNAASAQTTLATRSKAATGAMRAQSGARPARGDAQDILVYGLRPWQLTNLGYQVNDVVSGLAMGQAPLQIFAQQAGQIAQIWPQAMVGIARSIPQLAALAVVMAPVVAAAMRLRNEAESIRIFSAELKLSADGARYSAEELAKVTREISEVGIATADARKLVSSFVREGFSQGNFVGLSEMAKQLDAVTGEGIVEAGARIAQAFSGSVESVRALDEELNFLTATQLQQITAMEKAGDRAGALSMAQDVLRERLRGTVSESGPWELAVKDLGAAWKDLVSAIAASGAIELAAEFLNLLGRAARSAASGVRGVTDALLGDGSIDDLRVQLAAIQSAISRRETGVQGWGTAEAIANLRKQEDALLSQIKAREDAQAKIVAKAEEERKIVEQTNDQQKAIQVLLDKQAKERNDELRLAELNNRQRYVEEGLLKAKTAALEEQKRLNQDMVGLTQDQTEALRKQLDTDFSRSQGAAFLSGGDISTYVNRVSGVESSGNRFASNPNSSALGLGQFIESTWLRMFKEHFPDRAKGMSDTVILALRTDAETSRAMIDLYARENAAILQKAGVAVNEASVYLAHFLGPRGAVALLNGRPTDQVSDLLPAEQINANRSVLEGKTQAQVVAWAREKMELSQADLDIITRRGEVEGQYAEDYRKRVEQAKFELDLVTKTAREAAIAKAVREEELRAQQAGVEFTKQAREETERLAAAEFDRKNVNEEVNRLLAQREQLFETLRIAQENGDQAKVVETIAQITALEGKLREIIPIAIAAWKAIGGPQSDEMIRYLENVRSALGRTVEEIESRFLPTAEEINERLAEVGANAFEAFAQALANGENAVQAFWDTMLRGIAQFLIEIGKALIQQALFNALSGGAGSGGSGGVGGFISGLIRGLVRHDGGLINNSGSSRMVNPAIFAGARRYHGGGQIEGLRRNEVPVIAEVGEEMLTADDPRHSRNGGGGTAVNLKNVNVFDATEVLQHALQSTAGEQVMVNWLTRNRRKVSTAVNG